MKKTLKLLGGPIGGLLLCNAQFIYAGPVADAEIMANNCEGIAKVAISEMFFLGEDPDRETLTKFTGYRINNLKPSYHKYLVITVNSVFDTVSRDLVGADRKEAEKLAIEDARLKCKIEFLTSYNS